MIRGMVIDMNDQQLLTLAQLRAFVDGTVAVDFQVTGEERYGFIARTIRRLGCGDVGSDHAKCMKLRRLFQTHRPSHA